MIQRNNIIYHIRSLNGRETKYENFVLTLEGQIARRLLYSELSEQESADFIRRFKADQSLNAFSLVRKSLSQRVALLEYLNKNNKKMAIYQGDLLRLRKGEIIDVRYSSFFVENEAERDRLLDVFDVYLEQIMDRCSVINQGNHQKYFSFLSQ